MFRRDLLKSIVASVPGALAFAPASGAEASSELEAMAGELTQELYASDGLALPIPIIPISPRAATERSCSAAVGNITSLGTVASSTASTSTAST
jgi:hypothetical protein